MRQYEPIWNKIKAEREAVLVVDPVYAARVKKAVIKEKDMDAAFKLLNDHDEWRLVISYDKRTRTMVFKLKQKFGIEERINL